MKKATEYSVNSDRIFLTPLTEPVSFNGIFRGFNGIFLTASIDTVSVPGTWPRVGARRSVPVLARGGACGGGKLF